MKHQTHTAHPPARRLPLCLAIAVALSTALISQAHATTRTWDGGAGDTSWNAVSSGVVTGSDGFTSFGPQLTNWSRQYLPSINFSFNGEPVPVHDTGLPVNGDSLVFQGSVGLNNTNTYTNFSASGISFATGAGPFVLGGNALTSTGNITNNSSHRQTLNMPITVGANQTWDGGTAGMTFNGGVKVSASELILRNGVTLASAGYYFAVGSTDTAALTIASGSAVTSAGGTIGDSAGSHGTVNVAGIGSKWSSGGDANTTYALYVGNYGTGTLNIENGGLVSSGYGYVGIDSDGNGTVNVRGVGSRWNNAYDLTVGHFGKGTLNINSGGVVSSNTGYVGNWGKSSGTVIVTGAGSQWNNSAEITVGNTGSGTLSVLDSGKVTAQRLTISANGTLNLGEGAQLSTVDGSFNNNSVTFNGNSTIQGNFTNNGSVVGSAGTLSFLNDVNGAGSYRGNIAFKAGFNPGNSPAAVSFGAGNASFDSASVLNMEIFGATPGAQYDQLVNINTLTFNGTLNLVFGNGYVPLAGSSFALFGFNTFSGSFGTAANGYDHITVSGYDRSKLDFSHLASDGTLSMAVAAVPEPESYAMLLAGLALLGTVVRRRRRAV